MKLLLTFISLTLLLCSCDDHNEDGGYIPGKIVTKINYLGINTPPTTKNVGSKSSLPVEFYTGFGDYITSVSPHVFKAKFICIRYVDDLDVFNQIELINNNLPDKDPLKYADFTNNSSATLVPELNGNLTNEGVAFADTVVFNYFYFRLQFFYQEIQLPEQYEGIGSLDQFGFNDAAIEEEYNQVYSSLENNILKARYRMFLYPLYEHVQRLPDAFVFGGTDSSYVLNLFTDPHDFPVNLPYDGDYIARSKNYGPITYVPTDSPDKTTVMEATMSFNYDDLIQIYAGKDNVPYTKDDVFLYEPNFWDRFKVEVAIE